MPAKKKPKTISYHGEEEDPLRPATPMKECESCRGYGHFDENGEATEDRRCRKCGDCGGTGEVPDKPKEEGASEETRPTAASSAADSPRQTAGDITSAACSSSYIRRCYKCKTPGICRPCFSDAVMCDLCYLRRVHEDTANGIEVETTSNFSQQADKAAAMVRQQKAQLEQAIITAGGKKVAEIQDETVWDVPKGAVPKVLHEIQEKLESNDKVWNWVVENAQPKPTSLSERLKEAKARGSSPLPAGVENIEVPALAGTGKTTSAVEGMKDCRGMVPSIKPSPQQAVIWEAMRKSKDARSICFTAYNNAIADELKARMEATGLSKKGCEAATTHSIGFTAVKRAFPFLKGKRDAVDKNKTDVLLVAAMGAGDIWQLRRDKPVLVKAAKELVSLCKQTLTDPTPEGLAQLISHHDVEVEGHEDELEDLVPRLLEDSKDPTGTGTVDFDDMCWLPVALNLPVYRHDFLIVDECQDLNQARQQLVLKAGSRIMVVGDEHQCQPAGTMVRVTGKSTPVPIESLKVGDSVVTYHTGGSTFIGKRTQGRKVLEIACREYFGSLYHINGSCSTPEHKWLTRFRPDVPAEFTALYLVELPDSTYRLGMTQLVMGDGKGGFGPAMRARQRGAEKLWVLRVYKSRDAAREAEFKNSMTYRIPQLACYEVRESEWCRDLVEEGIISDVEELLNHYSQIYDYPIWVKGGSQHIGKYTYITQACNLIPEVNQVCTWRSGSPEWVPLDIGVESDWSGTVHSIKVQPTEGGNRLYISDDVVTHNSIYGFSGADVNSMRHLRGILSNRGGCVSLPLTVTRRCGRAIVAEAQRFVPEFEAHPSNCDGRIGHARFPEQRQGEGRSGYGVEKRTIILPWEKTYGPLVKPGDFVLCRCNAPLVQECFRFIKRGIKANVRGRSIGDGLVTLVQKLTKDEGSVPIPVLAGLLAEWLESEQAKEHAKKNPCENKLNSIQDRHDCLLCLAGGQSPAADSAGVITRINSIFTDASTTGIILSSVHKAKGLEADNVFILQPPGIGPREDRLHDWEIQQEQNIKYVAITRAREGLTYVS